MKNCVGSWKSLLFCSLLFPLTATAESGSELNQFEEDATTPRVDEKKNADTQPRHVKHREKSVISYSDDEEDEGGDVFDSLAADIAVGVIKVAYYAITAPGIYSWDRVQASSNSLEAPDATPREMGERVIPFVRFGAYYSRVDSDIHAHSERVELGYGPFAFQARGVHYTESDPPASLDIKQHHWLYRMSLGDSVELDLGLGGYEISGASTNSGGSSTIHLLIYPNEHLGIELRPSWATLNGNEISDHELDITYSEKYWSVLAGYHWLETSDSSLNAPFVGFSLRI